ncbi:adenylyltransferase and sulfurtransferase MOCS3 [Euwallacea fornicatus]|uniref:adenylyltransferase and sulfurtransferase MOCS3 n=1 Tax=Euwallacea fornicatus TaxID=995702 RepID=UPI0033902A41
MIHTADYQELNLIREIKALKAELRKKEKELSNYLSAHPAPSVVTKYVTSGLTNNDIVRYSRQLLVPEVNTQGQLKMKNSKVLIVGAGGLGCPSAVYLAAAGIGEITLVDSDKVDITNLHRQILHTEDDIGVPKVDSAYDKLHSINRSIQITPLKLHLDSNSMKTLMSSNKFDLVIDGSDNVATRYLLSDACVFHGVPLVSGSALQMEAQLTVYHYKNGPCYRCLFPVPPPPEAVTSCADGGVIGPVPGVIGVLQALESIKILTNSSDVLSGRLLLFDGSTSTFRNIKLRPKNPKCAVCGTNPTVTDLIDYEQFCMAKACDKTTNIDILDSDEHISVQDFHLKLGDKLVLDVRPQVQFEACHLPETVNMPWDDIRKPGGLERVSKLLSKHKDVYVLCRKGNDSQQAISYLKRNLTNLAIRFFNVKGGLQHYYIYIDSGFPFF